MFEKKKSDWRFWCWYTQDAKYKGRTGPINGVQTPNMISAQTQIQTSLLTGPINGIQTPNFFAYLLSPTLSSFVSLSNPVSSSQYHH